MARRRYISTKLSLDVRVNRLAMQAGDFTALLYTWMIPHAEDDGRLTGDPDELLMTVCPGRRDKSAEDIETALLAMCHLGLIQWDRESGFIQFPDSFYEYQSYIKSRKPAHIQESPDPNDDNSANQRKSAQISASRAPASFSSPVSSPSSFSADDQPTAAEHATDAVTPPPASLAQRVKAAANLYSNDVDLLVDTYATRLVAVNRDIVIEASNWRKKYPHGGMSSLTNWMVNFLKPEDRHLPLAASGKPESPKRNFTRVTHPGSAASARASPDDRHAMSQPTIPRIA